HHERHALQQAYLGIGDGQRLLDRLAEDVEQVPVDKGEHGGDRQHADGLPCSRQRRKGCVGGDGCGNAHSAAAWSATKSSLSLYFWILVEDMGHAVTKRTWRGTLKLAILPLQNSMISCSVAWAPGRNSMKAAATSSRRGSGTPTTCTSFTA